MAKVVLHPIRDNRLMINNKEFFGINISKVIVGVENSDQTELLTDENTELNYSKTAVEGQEIYNISTQKHHPWFILDLETGSRDWYPGSLLYCSIIGTVDVKEQPNESSATLFQLTDMTVLIISTQSKKQIEQMKSEWWIKIKADQEGYIQIKDIDKNSLRYEVPSDSSN